MVNVIQKPIGGNQWCNVQLLLIWHINMGFLHKMNMKTNNKTAKSITMPGRARRPKPKHQITRPPKLMRVEIVPLATWEAIADQMPRWAKVWEEIQPHAGFTVELTVDDIDGIIENVLERVKRFHHNIWDASAPYWGAMVRCAILEHVGTNMDYYDNDYCALDDYDLKS